MDFLSFGVDMPLLFERAVAVLLGRALGDDLVLVTKPRIVLGVGMRFEPNLVVEDGRGRPVAVIDTKYKTKVLDVDV